MKQERPEPVKLSLSDLKGAAGGNQDHRRRPNAGGEDCASSKTSWPRLTGWKAALRL